MQMVRSLILLLASGLVCAASAETAKSPDTPRVKVIYSVEYATHDELKVDGTPTGEKRSLLTDIYLPPGEGPFPTVLMVHGGAWFSGNKAHVTLHARHAAEAGYAVIAINYRLAPNYKFPSQLEDLRSALSFIKRESGKYRFDTKRVAAYGYSAGAQLVSLLGTTQNQSKPADTSVMVRAIVAGGTPCEFTWIPEESQRLVFWLGGSRKENPDNYRKASPTSFVDAGDPPVFLFHGAKDRIVPISSPKAMKQLLDQHGIPNEFRVLDESNHLGAFVDSKSREAAIQFLNKYL